MPVDCGAIPAALLESELFGAMQGAFTGADRDRIGVFEAANRGTVFLDEIGDIDPAFQVKLLRFLQEREIRPVGASREKKVDVRVIAATNRDLQKMVEEGKFREDLWFRLNVVRLELPPLRERRRDVPLLAHFFVNKYNERYNRDVKLTESGLKALKDFTWPGNVRQLQHLMERLTILAPNERIDAEAVHDAISAMEPKRRRRRDAGGDGGRPDPARAGGDRAGTRAGRPQFWASSARRFTASWSGCGSDSTALRLGFQSHLHPFRLRVKLAAEERDERENVHPGKQRDAGADAAIEQVVVRDVADIPAESQGGQHPQNGGQQSARPDRAPALFPVTGRSNKSSRSGWQWRRTRPHTASPGRRVSTSPASGFRMGSISRKFSTAV